MVSKLLSTESGCLISSQGAVSISGPKMHLVGRNLVSLYNMPNGRASSDDLTLLEFELRPLYRRRGKMRLVNTQSQDPDENFDSLLEWLDPDRDRAAGKYLSIRQSLTKIFTWQGVADAEFLTDKTLDRVVSRGPELRNTYKGDPSIYIYGVAKMVLKEHWRTEVRQVGLTNSIPDNQTTDVDEDRVYDCLERCLAALSPSSRALILDYYSRDRSGKISSRKELAESLQIAPEQLRVQAFRIRSTLERCIETCMKREGES